MNMEKAFRGGSKLKQNVSLRAAPRKYQLDVEIAKK